MKSIDEIFKDATQKVTDASNLVVRLEKEPGNPRDFASEESVMLCLHERHTLGDRQSFDYLKSSEDVSGWETMKEAIMKDEAPVSILPLFLLDHSGLTVSTSAFSCPWDSGQVGYIYSNTLCEEELEHQVQDYNRYLNGESWEWIYEECDGSWWGSCGGYKSESDARQGGQCFLEEREAARNSQVYVTSVLNGKKAIESGLYSAVFIDVALLLKDKITTIDEIAFPDIYVDLWSAEDIANNSDITEEQAIKVIAELNKKDGLTDYSDIQGVVDNMFGGSNET
jgi:hypothetical protein